MDAVAVIATAAGAVNVAPLAGAVTETMGATAAPTVTLTGTEVFVVPLLP